MQGFESKKEQFVMCAYKIKQGESLTDKPKGSTVCAEFFLHALKF